MLRLSGYTPSFFFCVNTQALAYTLIWDE